MKINTRVVIRYIQSNVEIPLCSNKISYSSDRLKGSIPCCIPKLFGSSYNCHFIDILRTYAFQFHCATTVLSAGEVNTCQSLYGGAIKGCYCTMPWKRPTSADLNEALLVKILSATKTVPNWLKAQVTLGRPATMKTV